MLTRRFLPTCFFAANLALMLLHCLYCDGQQIATTTRLSTAIAVEGQIPVETPPRECANESGCPCRGATICSSLADEVTSPLANLSWDDLSLAPFERISTISGHFRTHFILDYHPPATGLPLYARNSCFLN